ncbi:MAG: OmpA family protein [Bacteroidales bacterium]|nr:OmpA family protein [Bacteroidales bacterium]
MRKLSTTLAMICLATMPAWAQYSTSNKKAAALLDQALSKYGGEMYEEATALADKALKLDSKFLEAYWLKADIAAKTNKPSDEIRQLTLASYIAPNNATTCIGLADAYFKQYENAKAIEQYNKLLQLQSIPEKMQKSALKNKEIAQFRIDAMAHPVDYKPRNLGPNVNTRYNDYFPSLSATGNTLVYTIELPQLTNNPMLPDTQEDIYITRRKDGQPWQQARSIGANINSANNEGAPFLSADGKILLLTSCTCPDGLIRCCDIYYSYYRNGEFSNPRALPAPINTGAWESQPCFSADNTTLYFVSNRPGGLGGKDIWFSKLLGDGKWSEPENCGPNVNTPGDEGSPFIHADGRTLYFASDGHIGMGGQDLFMSQRQQDGSWGKAENLGYPINTKDNETRLAVSVFGNTAIISSDRGNDTGLDLYEITLPQGIRPRRTLLVAGAVKDAVTQAPINSEYELTCLDNGKASQLGRTFNNENINLLLYLPEGHDYALNVKSDGYLMNSMNFSLRNIPDSVTRKYIEIGLHKPDIGTVVVLENIFFETDKYNLKPESYYELDKLVDYLCKNPSLRIEIGGHTDNAGSEPHNLELSDNRAKTIVNYLIAKNISPSRLTSKGYGSSKPCVPNTSKENMAKNRRTEFKIIN